MKNKSPVVSLISLGCAKNSVDSELVLGFFVQNGWMIAEEPADSDVCLVNTCGFIEDARKEAESVLSDVKKVGVPIIALGCLVKRAQDVSDFGYFLDAADKCVSFNEYGQLPQIAFELIGGQSEPLEPQNYFQFITNPRLRFGYLNVAHLKISEGCSNSCAFCSIPHIRGKQVSRPMEDIISEAKLLVESGACELNIIAQDSTAYGKDWDGKLHLPELLRRLLCEIKENVWFRIMYACPQHIIEELLKVIASDERFCPYIDVPLQHISDKMLIKMGRKLNKEQTLEKLNLIRKVLPNCAIRTTFIVGHPGETNEDFAELVDFVEQGHFTHAGVFTYSPEIGTLSLKQGDDVPEDVKKTRQAILMEVQRRISSARCASFVGKTIEVMVDGIGENGELVARSQHEAIDVDGVCYLPMYEDAVPGDRYDVEIVKSSDYDLWGQ